MFLFAAETDLPLFAGERSSLPVNSWHLRLNSITKRNGESRTRANQRLVKNATYLVARTRKSAPHKEIIKLKTNQPRRIPSSRGGSQ